MARILTLLFIFLTAGALKGEELLWPLPDHTYLTGGYADSRYDHFHGGVDIRTGGEHLAVLAPADGKIERLAVTPSGYGKVVYFRMKNDTTAVFGHLDGFAPRLESIVRDSQLVAGTYRVDLIYEQRSDDLEFKRGETLAYTGETGRGAPHLHFELRKEAVQIDPLAAYPREDTQPPVITELRYIELQDLNLRSIGTKLSLVKDSDGNYSTSAVRSNEPVAFLISCYDPGPWNRHAVPSAIRVIVDSDTVYETFPTEIDLLGPKDIYAKLVWKQLVERDHDVRRLFTFPEIPIGKFPTKGWITEVWDEQAEIEVEDRAGNKTSVQLKLSVDTSDRISGFYLEKGINSISQFSLTGNEEVVSWATLEMVSEHEVNVGDPLDGFSDRLVLTYSLLSDEDPEGLYWYKKSSKGRSALWTVPNEPDSIMSCHLQRGGTFGLAKDTTPPRLLLSRNGRGFKFDLRDAETGIDDSTVRCTIDGITAIPEYEYEENGGAIWTRNTLAAGEHTIVFTAANRAGVAKEWTVSMTLP
ncbi:M23 family metallopeptidase [bacterium]|nr:MAG: M23 family metallopeptidase [bacterium]